MNQKQKLSELIEKWQRSADDYKDGLQKAIDTIAGYREELAALDEPRLEHEHGEYGFDYRGKPCATGLVGNKLACISPEMVHDKAEDARNSSAVPNYVVKIKIGNTFTELAAMAVDKTEFEINDTKACIDKIGDLWIKDDDDDEEVLIEREDIPAFIIGLRTLQASQIRKEHG